MSLTKNVLFLDSKIFENMFLPTVLLVIGLCFSAADYVSILVVAAALYVVDNISKIVDVEESDFIPNGFNTGPERNDKVEEVEEVYINTLSIVPGTRTSVPCLVGKFNKFYSGELI